MGEEKSQDSAQLERNLEVAVREGLLDHVEGSNYRFSHSRIREGIRALLPVGNELKNLQASLGRSLLEMSEEANNDQLSDGMVLVAANLLNASTEDSDRKDLLELNFRAAKIATFRSAYAQAAKYFENARRFEVQEGKWDGDRYSFTYELLIHSAKCLLYTGDLEGCLAVARDITENVNSLEDRLPTVKLQAEALLQLSRYDEGLQILLEALDALGHHLPRRFLMFRFFQELNSANNELRKMSDQDILDLPVNTDPMDQCKIDLLWSVATISALTDREAYKGIAFLGVMRFVLKVGTVPGILPMCLSAAAMGYYKLGMMEMCDRLSKLTSVLLDNEGTENVHAASTICLSHFML